jgi:ribose 5-phosphate isomerase RpiB
MATEKIFVGIDNQRIELKVQIKKHLLLTEKQQHKQKPT